MMFDTDVLVWASRGNLNAARVIDQTTERAISIISLMELQLRFRILPLSESIGSTAAAIVEQYSLAHGIQLAQALIAAAAIETGQPLCTANIKHFRPIVSLARVAFRP